MANFNSDDLEELRRRAEKRHFTCSFILYFHHHLSLSLYSSFSSSLCIRNVLLGFSTAKARQATKNRLLGCFLFVSLLRFFPPAVAISSDAEQFRSKNSTRRLKRFSLYRFHFSGSRFAWRSYKKRKIWMAVWTAIHYAISPPKWHANL